MPHPMLEINSVQPYSAAMPAGRTPSIADPRRGWSIVGAASGVGAADRGCALGPEAIFRGGLRERLRASGCPVRSIHKLLPAAPGYRIDPVKAVADFCIDLAGNVSAILRREQRFIVLGGDHSCAIGSWSGVSAFLRKSGPLGLLWIDAHMDSHVPETSPSGAIHGMPVACLLGYGAQRLTQLFDPAPKLRPQHLCLVGVRSFEQAEARLLARIGVRVYSMDVIRRHGLAAVLGDALEIVTAGTAGFGISIDLDAIDPADAPGVGTPVAGGIGGRELVAALPDLVRQPGFLGIEIAEYNPLYDRTDRTAQLAGDLLVASCLSSREYGHASDHRD
jgi:arginase